jgi:hypothetical protein
MMMRGVYAARVMMQKTGCFKSRKRAECAAFCREGKNYRRELIMILGESSSQVGNEG